MLRATFQGLIKGIGAKRERYLWERGVSSWEQLDDGSSIDAPSALHDSRSTRRRVARLQKALESRDVALFARLLAKREHYRIALEFPGDTVFLDIETTGLSRYYDDVTVVGWWYRGCYRALVQGADDSTLRATLERGVAIVTFNGTLFDLPFLRARMPRLRFPPVHVDLRYLARRVGLAGGQKAIEQAIGLRRHVDVAGLSGEQAPVLWHRYRRGDLGALRALIEYNFHDLRGMRCIFDVVVSRLTGRMGLPRSVREKLHRFSPPGLGAEDPNMSVALRELTVQPYRGPTGPRVHLRDLLPDDSGKVLRVVGIDLSGSEARPSGWCMLKGTTATTLRLHTDAELIAATLKAAPAVVSIDSPLSLPTGRTGVSDDDPGRRRFGIMRSCERILRQRGINVYPALIPSMQRLTERGMRLAAALRQRGLAVIESYPGAAQDVMGIPRKRASLAMLEDGLAEFGVSGRFLTHPVSHDELDAITSAVVGVFFWSGRFESLGDGEGEALIIPDLDKFAPQWAEHLVIGISGRIRGGITAIAHHFAATHCAYAAGYSPLNRTRTPEIAWSDSRPIICPIRRAADRAAMIERYGPAFKHVHLKNHRGGLYPRGEEPATKGFMVCVRDQLSDGDNPRSLLLALADVVVFHEGQPAGVARALHAVLPSWYREVLPCR